MLHFFKQTARFYLEGRPISNGEQGFWGAKEFRRSSFHINVLRAVLERRRRNVGSRQGLNLEPYLHVFRRFVLLKSALLHPEILNALAGAGHGSQVLIA